MIAPLARSVAKTAGLGGVGEGEAMGDDGGCDLRMGARDRGRGVELALPVQLAVDERGDTIVTSRASGAFMNEIEIGSHVVDTSAMVPVCRQAQHRVVESRRRSPPPRTPRRSRALLRARVRASPQRGVARRGARRSRRRRRDAARLLHSAVRWFPCADLDADASPVRCRRDCARNATAEAVRRSTRYSLRRSPRIAARDTILGTTTSSAIPPSVKTPSMVAVVSLQRFVRPLTHCSHVPHGTNG